MPSRTHLVKRNVAALLAAMLPLGCSHSAAAPRFALTIDNIMRGPGLTGYEPAEIRWSPGSERVYFNWKQAGDPVLQAPATWSANRDGSSLRKLSETEARNAPAPDASWSKDHRRLVWAKDGDLYLLDSGRDQARQLTRTAESETDPHLLPGGRSIFFTRANNLYVMSLEDGALVQVTDIRPAGSPPPPGDEKKGTEGQENLRSEEKNLLDVIRQRAENKKIEDDRRKRENGRKPHILAERETVTSLQLAPGGKYVIAAVAERPEKGKATAVPNFVTESAYTEEIPSRSKAGDQQTEARLAVIAVDTGEWRWVEHGQRKAGSRAQATTEKNDRNPAKKAESEERPLTLQQPLWSEDGTRAVLMARSRDNKDRWVMALDPVTAKTRVLAAIHDDAWVDGPGASTLGWLQNDREVYFQSEQSGYSHLYAVRFDGGEPRALTSGSWEVTAVQQLPDKSRLYLTTTEASPFERHLYEMPGNGGPLRRVTNTAGHHQALVSPDGSKIADVYSYTNKPPELFVSDAASGAVATQVTHSPAADLQDYPWLDAPIVRIPARDGAQLPARLYRPGSAPPGGPAVVFVHGAGYLQNVHRGWSYYSREYLFHHFLAANGYTVVEVDYRGSAGYGRDWRTAIYRHMGGKDLDDQVDAARWLVSTQSVDPKRIGIYGGSYGGFLTLMAMFTQPDVFAAGAALRPVSDWAHYNHAYTTNILNVPQEDPEAYRHSSPIYFANGLKGALLICHGMVDTNVHFQDTVRLVQRLIELRKPNWEVAIYPAEDHAFVQPTSWADEYKRIFQLFETNLKPPSAAPERSSQSGHKH